MQNKMIFLNDMYCFFIKKVNSFALIWYSGNNFIPLHRKQDVLFIRAINETSSCHYSDENIDKTLRV